LHAILDKATFSVVKSTNKQTKHQQQQTHRNKHNLDNWIEKIVVKLILRAQRKMADDILLAGIAM
jgi:hypothetical protein